MTIAERFTRTTSRTARIMLQDEAAIVGAQAEVPVWLEGKLVVAEANDKELHNDTSEPCSSPATHGHHAEQHF